jgi:hypothetical protein
MADVERYHLVQLVAGWSVGGPYYPVLIEWTLLSKCVDAFGDIDAASTCTRLVRCFDGR